jgi:hypothetical protein
MPDLSCAQCVLGEAGQEVIDMRNTMDNTGKPSAVGVFNDLDKAERTIEELRRAGFESDEIGIIGHVGENQPLSAPPDVHPPEDNAITGIIRGGIIGAIVGLVVILMIPGLGEVTRLGYWFEILGGIIVGAVVCGVLVALSSLIFMRPETRVFSAELEKGNFIVAVKNPARKDEAVSVLRRQGLLVK